jgi:hypothetical protein
VSERWNDEDDEDDDYEDDENHDADNDDKGSAGLLSMIMVAK